MILHAFEKSLTDSHAQEGAAWLENVYRQFFPTLQAVHTHNADGQGQRQGIDKTVVFENGAYVWVDEKLRYKDYPDIAVEEWSNRQRNIPGWVVKPLLCHYFAYINIPGRKAYLLPTIQTQTAWRIHGDAWKKTRNPIIAKSEHNGRTWESISWGIAPEILFPAIGSQLRSTFNIGD